MAEMTFFESFRFIDVYAEAVLKLREAAHAVKKNGTDLEAWEREGKALKSKIQAEVDALNDDLRLALQKREGQKVAFQEEEKSARAELGPTFKRLENARSMLAKVVDELNEAREEKVRVADSTEEDAQRIIKNAKEHADQIKYEVEEKQKASEQRLLGVEDRIEQLKQGITNL